MRKIALIASLAALCMAGSSYAQQDPQLTQFMWDRLSVNPAVAGSKSTICATAFYRNQWSGFSGAPTTGLLNISAPIESIRSGVGLTVLVDEIGPTSYTSARASYAYQLKIGGATKMGLGASIGLISGSISPDWVAYDYGDNGGNVGIGTGVNDPSIPQNSQSSSTFDASFGVYFSNPKYYVGLSATHLTQGGLDNLNYENARHYYLMAGYDFEISSVLNLQPNILAKTEASSFQLDGNVNLMYDNTLWVGVSYRLEDAIAPQVGYQYVTANGKNTLRAGYSYDVTTSDISNYSNGSHEVMLSYCFKIEKPLPKRVYKNVRFL